MPFSPIARIYRFVRGDGSLTLCVAILALFIFALYPMIEVGAISPWWLDIAFEAWAVLRLRCLLVERAFSALIWEGPSRQDCALWRS